MSERLSHLTVDRTAFTVSDLKEPTPEKAYWLSRTTEERLQALEVMRQVLYPDAGPTARLQRILEVVERPRR